MSAQIPLQIIEYHRHMLSSAPSSSADSACKYCGMPCSLCRSLSCKSEVLPPVPWPIHRSSNVSVFRSGASACHLKAVTFAGVCVCLRVLMSLAESERSGRRDTCSISRNINTLSNLHCMYLWCCGLNQIAKRQETHCTHASIYLFGEVSSSRPIITSSCKHHDVASLQLGACSECACKGLHGLI